jgi:hypothetical protein
MFHPLSARADAAPPADETYVAKERRFNRHRIEPRHVFGGVFAFDVEAIGLRDHVHRLSRATAHVQREF